MFFQEDSLSNSQSPNKIGSFYEIESQLEKEFQEYLSSSSSGEEYFNKLIELAKWHE